MEAEGPPPWTSSSGGPPEQPPPPPAAEVVPPAPPPPPPAVRAPGYAVPPGAPPPGDSPGATVPPGGARGSRYARNIFLYLGGNSLLAGLVYIVASSHMGTGAAAAVFGVVFAVLFFVALMLRPGPGLDPVRATLGIVAIGFMVLCFALAVGLADSGPVDMTAQLVRLAVAAGLFTLGAAGVGVLIPSAVGSGLALVGLVATVVLATAAAGVTAYGLVVAALVASAAALEVAFRVPRLQAHPAAAAWMVNIGGLLLGVSAIAVSTASEGTAVAAAGLAGGALAVIAWRWHSVVAAAVATSPLGFAEVYAISQSTGNSPEALGVVLLLVGLVILLVVALVGRRTRFGTLRPRGRPVLVDELLLVAAVVVALISLTQTGNGFGPFQRPFFSPSTPFTQPTFPELTPPGTPNFTFGSGGD